MSPAGHIYDMINRVKSNKTQFKSRRERIAKIKQMYLNASHSCSTTKGGASLSEQEIALIKNQIRETLKKERLQRIRHTALAAGVLSVVLIAIMYILTFTRIWC